MEFGTSFSKLKIMRTAIAYSTKKCDVLVNNREHYTLLRKSVKLLFCPTFVTYSKGKKKILTNSFCAT